MQTAAAATGPADPAALPEWDLRDLYPGRDSPELHADLEKAAAEAKAFRLRFQGKLAALDGAALGGAVASYEAIQEVLGRIMSYAQLVHAGNMTDPEIGRFYQTMQERVTDISTDLLFFALELNRLEDAVLDEKLNAQALARYRPWLRDLRAMRPHQLSDEVEQLLHEKQIAGRNAWIRLFDETIAHLRFPLRHRKVIRTTNLLERLFLEERRRTKIIPHAFGERPVLKLMYAAVIRAADRWRGIAIGEFEQRQLRAIRDELSHAHAARVAPAVTPKSATAVRKLRADR